MDTDINIQFYKRSRQTGFTLVELMVAIALSALLLFGVLQIFDANRQSLRLQHAFAEVQENGRIAMELITRDVRMADYWGCAPGTDTITNHLDVESGSWMNFANAKGIEGKNDVKNEQIGTKNVKEGTDVLILRGSYQPRSAKVVSPYVSTDKPVIHISTGANIKQGDVLMITDCTGGDLFVNTEANTGDSGQIRHGATEAKSGVRNTDAALSHPYTAGAQIVVPFERIYFIGKNADNGWSLYRSDNSVVSELVRNVNDLQIFYGADSDADGSADTYGVASTVKVDEVVSIRAQISTHSVEKVASGAVLERRYTTTANVRNRSL